jgi:tetratricopeptide (TPR) repeat protein
VYGQPLPVLVAGWGRFVDGLQSPEGQQELARERLSQPTVFHKVCAHELAQKREEASHAAAAGDHARALRLLGEVCNDDPDDPDNLAERMDSARAGKLDDEAAATAKQLLLHPKVTPALRARAEALLGDLALARDDFDAAGAAYARALALPLDEATGRLLTVKRLATTRKDQALIDFLIKAPRDPALMLAAARELTLGNDDGLYLYLHGRQLFEHGQWERAADALERSRVGLPDARFTREADRLAGIARFLVRQFDAALADFQRLADGAPEGVRLVAAEWIDRVKWARK